jgi:CheY-like chemotaxis protein
MAKYFDLDGGASRKSDVDRADEVLHGVRVLVIDDHEDARRVLGDYLTFMGATVTVAASGEEGLIMYRDVLPDVVITDIAMPKVDGYQVARDLRTAARARRHRLRIVAVTAFWESHPELRAVRAGFDAWVTKPVKLPALAALVAKLTRHKRPG